MRSGNVNPLHGKIRYAGSANYYWSKSAYADIGTAGFFYSDSNDDGASNTGVRRDAFSVRNF